ncbi:DNA polymerase IV [Erysipelothrix sp. HDW6A]|nr:DNA polymerase IV [Erysipelothrix sp. HDW6A]
MKNPSLKDVPMCVGGSEKGRHGIVVARNLKAKEYGVKTAETLREAKRKCPGIKVVSPSYDDYHFYTEKVKDIYREYSDRVDSFGLDEAWIDISDSWKLFVDKPLDLPKIIQDRVFNEIGLTVSIGVFWNKIYAKLGSDLIKPSGLVMISEGNYESVVFPLPVEDLLMVGEATKKTLNNIGVVTIGDLARMPLDKAKSYLGKQGTMIWYYANGLDESDVSTVGYSEKPKSISNGTTPPDDINTLEEAKVIMTRLCESVALRTRNEELRGCVVSINFRDTELKSTVRQRRIDNYIDVSTDILKIAVELLELNHDFKIPLRRVIVGLSGLKNKDAVIDQITIYDAEEVKAAHREAQIDKTIEDLRKRFGFKVIKRANALLNEQTENFNPNASKSVLPNSRNNKLMCLLNNKTFFFVKLLF